LGKKIPPTIKSAHISGVYGIIASLIGAFIGGYFLYQAQFRNDTEDIKDKHVDNGIYLKDEPSELIEDSEINISNELNDNDPTHDYIIKIIKDFFNYERIELDDFGWVDLASRGTQNELYVTYFNGYNYLLDVFSINQDKPEHIYRHVGGLGDLNATPFYSANKTFLICSLREGSGVYLTLSILEYDGISKLYPIFTISPEDALYKGSIWVTNNEVFITGNNKKYVLKYENGDFILDTYTQRLSAPPFSGTNILSVDIDNDENLLVSYNGKRLSFNQVDEITYQSQESIEIDIDELIVIDDNIYYAPMSHIRFLANNKFEFIPGFFTSIIPKNPGNARIILIDIASYYINFQIMPSQVY